MATKVRNPKVTNKHQEVLCWDCDKSILHRNLKRHYKDYHDDKEKSWYLKGQKSMKQYFATRSKDILESKWTSFSTKSWLFFKS